MKNIVSILIILTILFSCKQNSEIKKNNERDFTAINDTLTKDLQKAFEKGAIIGFSVSVVDENGVVYENGFGYRDIELEKKYTPNTTQNIASISKTLIGVSLLKAQELGKLNLDDPINKYLPFKITNPNYPDKPILIKHLAYHSSSIIDVDEVYAKSYVLKKSKHNDNEGVYDWFSMPEKRISLIEFLNNSLTENGKWYTKEIFANIEPGVMRKYSNIGAALCAQIIEYATGQDYQSFTKDYILQPLKMTSSGWSSKDIDTTKRSRLFANKEMLIAEYSLITYADGGFITSNNDLGLFLTELMKGYKGSGTLLNKESYTKLFKKQKFPNVETEQEFGIFMEFSKEFIKIKDDVIGHNGSDPGVMTAMYFNPKTETGKILLVNTDSDFNENFWPEVASIWNSLIKYETELNSGKASR
ncbi:beta-lactamase family protein [Aquimarina sp. ERC-38]|uniref:serine hydrolase domain-containing protein n=1 Tax=Aquimarina sp. ERC-38 TaxID=2949996 RepID=UPI002245607E|nr:serine hydrolase domain-containing protein [Aquimarina sp. ERC-38]UZO80006.1 beta-lactamase family protein [Aquimarina sp. ERC-38]